MQHTNIFGFKALFQKYQGTSARVGYVTCRLCASSGPIAESVPTKNQRGLGPGNRLL